MWQGEMWLSEHLLEVKYYMLIIVDPNQINKNILETSEIFNTGWLLC